VCGTVSSVLAFAARRIVVRPVPVIASSIDSVFSNSSEKSGSTDRRTWQTALAGAIVRDCRSIPGFSGKLILFVQSDPHAERRSLRHAGFHEPLDEHVAMREATQVAAEETSADGRADPVPCLDEELGLFH
jgi:hypothetical protein